MNILQSVSILIIWRNKNITKACNFWSTEVLRSWVWALLPLCNNFFFFPFAHFRPCRWVISETRFIHPMHVFAKWWRSVSKGRTSARGRERRQEERWDTENESERWEQRILVRGPIRGARDEEDTQAHTHMQTIPLPLGRALQNNPHHFVLSLFFSLLFIFSFPRANWTAAKSLCKQGSEPSPARMPLPSPRQVLNCTNLTFTNCKEPPMLLLCLSTIPLCQERDSVRIFGENWEFG